MTLQVGTEPLSSGHRLVGSRVLHKKSTLTGLAISFGLLAGLGTNGYGYASEGTSKQTTKVTNARAHASGQPLRVASALENLRRLPESVRTSLQASAMLSSKDICRIAEDLLQTSTVRNIDTVAHYLSKDVHRWSDRMITLYLQIDPKQARAAQKSEMKERVLQKWDSNRGTVQEWVRRCGLLVRTAIRGGRPLIERNAPELLADIVSVIATGVRRNEPDAIAAGEALVRADEHLRISLK